MCDCIREYLTMDDCVERSGGNNFECEKCSYKEECLGLANQRCDSEFAENINYGGHDTEEEFWENLLD